MLRGHVCELREPEGITLAHKPKCKEETDGGDINTPIDESNLI